LARSDQVQAAWKRHKEFAANYPDRIVMLCDRATVLARSDSVSRLRPLRDFTGGNTMANVYIEPRPKGRPEGEPIHDYVVEDHADHVLATFKTQHEAIEWAKKNGHVAHVARVRHLNDKKKADHWRAA
jgi:hypothetical protein